jgi:hypothetical protein
VTTDPVERFFMERTARNNRRARLRTMSSSEILDTAVRTYQQLGWTFLKLTIVPSLFTLSALAFVRHYILPSFLSTKDASSLATQYGEVAIAIALAIFVGGPLLIVGVSATTAIVTQLVADYMLGNVPSPDAAVRAARNTIFTLTKVHLRELFLACGGILAAFALSILSSMLDQTTSNENLVAGVVAFFAIVGFVVGGVIFLVVVSRHALAAPVAVLEGVKAKQASRRSVVLMKGQGPIPSGYGSIWSLYTILFVLALLMVSGLTGFLSMVGFPDRFESYLDNVPFGGLLIEAMGLIPLFLWVWTTVPVWAVTVAIVYYERRIRLEGYDIEALAADVWRSDRQSRFEL